LFENSIDAAGYIFGAFGKLIEIVAFKTTKKLWSYRDAVRHVIKSCENNLDLTLVALASHKANKPNYYLDAAISEALLSNDQAFIAEVYDLIVAAHKKSLPFDPRNLAFILNVGKTIKDKDAENLKANFTNVLNRRKEINNVLRALRAQKTAFGTVSCITDLDHNDPISDDESNTPEKFYNKAMIIDERKSN
jgi:hypothetical protein